MTSLAEAEAEQTDADDEEASSLATQSGNIPGKPYEGKFGAWLRAARIAARMTQGELSAASRISPSWISQIETGNNFPNQQDRDKLIVAIDVTQTPAARAAWMADRRKIDRADTKKQHPLSLFCSRDARRAQGIATRLRILQIVADLQIREGMTPLASQVMDGVRLNKKVVDHHVLVLERQGHLARDRFRHDKTGDQKKTVTRLSLTPQGLAHAIACGERTQTWFPPWKEASPLLQVMAQFVLAERGMVPKPDLTLPERAAPPVVSSQPISRFTIKPETGPMLGLSSAEQLVLWSVTLAYGSTNAWQSAAQVAQATGLSSAEVVEAGRALLSEGLLLCDHDQGGVLRPSREGHRWVSVAGWKSPPPPSDPQEEDDTVLEGKPDPENEHEPEEEENEPEEAPPSSRPSEAVLQPARPVFDKGLTDEQLRTWRWIQAAQRPVTEEEIAAGIGITENDVYAACERLLDEYKIAFSKADYTYTALR